MDFVNRNNGTERKAKPVIVKLQAAFDSARNGATEITVAVPFVSMGGDSGRSKLTKELINGWSIRTGIAVADFGELADGSTGIVLAQPKGK